MNPVWRLQTGRLVLTPVGWVDLPELVALKGDPRAYAVMLGGVRAPHIVAEELACEAADWARLGYGIWVIRTALSSTFVGLAGLQDRPDGRGVGLRFALSPSQTGQGHASEAAGAVLRFGHERAGLTRIVAVAREDNIASRQVLGAIGMRGSGSFLRDGRQMLIFASER